MLLDLQALAPTFCANIEALLACSLAVLETFQSNANVDGQSRLLYPSKQAESAGAMASGAAPQQISNSSFGGSIFGGGGVCVWGGVSPPLDVLPRLAICEAVSGTQE